MRISIFLLFLTLSCNNVKDHSIGQENSAGKYVLNEEVKDSIASAWNAVLQNDSIMTSITELKIIKDKDLKSQKDFFGILGTAENDSVKVMTSVELKSGKFYFEKKEVNTTVICSGSANCIPRMYSEKWVCDDGSGKETCSKNCIKKTIASVKD